jgi:GNAT superfamily N-acetyltransferase
LTPDIFSLRSPQSQLAISIFAVNPDQDLVGMVFLVHEPEGYLNIRSQLWVMALFVKTPYRSQGVGRALLGACERQGRRLGYSDLYLDTAEAAGYYAKLEGWEKIGSTRWEKNGLQLTVMRKTLSGNIPDPK